MPDATGKLDMLLARLVDETISDDEVRELEAVLDGNPGAQQRYLHYLGLHADLQDSGTGTPSHTTGPGQRRVSRAAMFAMAAVLAALVVIVALVSRPNDPGPAPAAATIATIGELNGSVSFTGDGGQSVVLDVGTEIAGGSLETHAANSWAEIEFRDGSSLWIHGAAQVALSEGDGGKLIRLRGGELTVNAVAQENGKPLRVVTPSAEAVVLGTRFDIAADSFTTRITVNEGLVRVKRLADGEVREVPADHYVVAALEKKTVFKVRSRRARTYAWASGLPRDARLGDWRPHADDRPGGLEAKPILWRKNREDEPLLLYAASLGPSREDARAHLTKKARLRIRGRLDTGHGVLFGFTTHHASGGFSGKYIAYREIELSEESGGRFVVSLPLEAFKPESECFPESPVGHELVDCWALTVKEDAGLEIASAELFERE